LVLVAAAPRCLLMLEAFDGLRLLVAPEGWFPAAWAWMRLLGFSPFGVATLAFDCVLAAVLVSVGTTAAEFEAARRRVGTLAAAADAAGDGLLEDEAA
jgi:hypothetical protein